MGAIDAIIPIFTTCDCRGMKVCHAEKKHLRSYVINILKSVVNKEFSNRSANFFCHNEKGYLYEK